MWLDEAKGEFILTEDDQMRCEDYAIDEDGNVYEYDYMEDALVKINAEAFNAEGFTLKFDENSQMCTEELIFASEGSAGI